VLVRVPLESPFVCPECGSQLTPPAVDEIKPLALRPAFLAAACGLAGLLATAAILAQAGFSRLHKPLAAPAEQPTMVSISAVTLEKPPPATVDEALVAPPPVIITALQLPAPRRRVTQAPPGRPGVPRQSAGSRRHSDVHMTFSVPLTAGGKPDYPEQYQDGQSGAVTVLCRLQSNGATQDCRTIRRSGAPLFDVAVHSWLDLRDVRFKPAAMRGRVANDVTFTVIFIGETGSS
jgi:TonB family protein